MRILNDDEFCEEVSSEDARVRNLLFSIIKGILVNGFELNRIYTIKEINKFFYFKQKDCFYNLNKFFEEKNLGEYVLSANDQKRINVIIQEHEKAREDVGDAKILFNKSFGRFKDEYEKRGMHHFEYNKFNMLYEKIKPIIIILHWGVLPIISEQLMVNSEMIPEDNILEFYNNYHMLEALLREINGEGEVMSLSGDNNLGKDMNFSVYSRRWGHNDHYRIRRTIDGWNVSHKSINGKCNKDGEGALINNLHHDSIFFPEEGVKYALEILWNEADEPGMSIEELQEKIQQIADWISNVEKNLGETQPEWVGYY